MILAYYPIMHARTEGPPIAVRHVRPNTSLSHFLAGTAPAVELLSAFVDTR
jgi:hypothetical protein